MVVPLEYLNIPHMQVSGGIGYWLTFPIQTRLQNPGAPAPN